MDKLEKIGMSEVEHLVKDITNIYVGSATGISRVVAEKNAANESNKVLPPVVPHQLVVFPHSELCWVVCTHREWLLSSGWSLPNIDEIYQEHHDIVWFASYDTALHDDLASCNDNMSFDDGWFIVKVRFESLWCSVVGITYILPGTEQMGSKFLIINDLFQPKTSIFSTRSLIWLHFKTVHYFYQPIFSLISHLKNALHNLVIELCIALKTLKNITRLFIKAMRSFVAIELLTDFKNQKIFYCSREILAFWLNK